jgi:hypothetical protein
VIPPDSGMPGDTGMKAGEPKLYSGNDQAILNALTSSGNTVMVMSPTGTPIQKNVNRATLQKALIENVNAWTIADANDASLRYVFFAPNDNPGVLMMNGNKPMVGDMSGK